MVLSRVLGRDSECEQLEELLAAVRGGESRSLVLRGEAGVGKTALMEHVIQRARGFRVASVTGVQSEMELAFAALHQLCAPMSEHLRSLPSAQRDALRAALGLGSQRASDGFLVALATLGLLAETARDRPLLCLVDDAQWLDRSSMQALAFAARRLRAESVAMIFAVRLSDDASSDPPEPAGLPELLVEGLPEREARVLLRSVLPGRWDEQVLERIVAEARGNPLALLELPKESTPTELAGGFGVPRARPVTDRLRATYTRRISELPPDTRKFLLAAAADPTGEPALLWRATERLGISVAAATPAVASGLIEIAERVRFFHPMIRSTVYWAASCEERRGTHRVLAAVTDPATDPDRRVWHAAHGAEGPDERIAVELERSAGRARTRGGLAAASAFMARAVELTPNAARRQERALAAARATHEAGAPDAALKLLSIVEAGPSDERRRTEVDLLRAQIAFTTDRGSEAPLLLLKAARRLEKHDVLLARDTYLEAINAAMFAGPLAYGGGQLEAAEAARSAPPGMNPPRPADLLLDGTATRLIEGHAAGVPTLRRALDAFRDPDLADTEGLRWLWLAGVTAVGLWDHEAWSRLSARHLDLARRAGQTMVLPLALTMRIASNVFAGDLSAAASLAEEVRTVSEAVGTPTPLYGALLLSAWQGREAECLNLTKVAAAEAARRGEGNGPVASAWARALLFNSLGRYKEALAAAREAVAEHQLLEIGVATWLLSECVEAAARYGKPEHAAPALRRLEEVTRPSGTDWSLGMEARSRALMSGSKEAEGHYREAIDRLGRTSVRGELARAHLLYGEWLRRGRRRQAARDQLRRAGDLFTEMGMDAFAQRAERELLATGESIRSRTNSTANELTPQELLIVRLVREGLTNPEIGTRLFLSPRTVEWHLRKIFGKLGVTSRRQLQITHPDSSI
ncbi:AAA family ATPase [Streptomyces cynarae]|uniref:AAA family ATPase n=1 Tax=Streptomyces cynarae TaxID=2981134 RepID=A0ABY6E138_9ACTN|nr:LuxR family transcriptional regulator [Streptomyces cynarae]UXY20380.1 AAA family ATPase [Streptomyces cynarae]